MLEVTSVDRIDGAIVPISHRGEIGVDKSETRSVDPTIYGIRHEIPVAADTGPGEDNEQILADLASRHLPSVVAQGVGEFVQHNRFEARNNLIMLNREQERSTLITVFVVRLGVNENVGVE